MQVFKNALEYWDFHAAENRIKQLSINHFEQYFPEYCRFLADIGKLDSLYDLLVENESKFKLSKAFRDLPIRLKLLLESLNSPNNNTIESVIFKKALSNNIVGIVDFLNSSWKEGKIAKEFSHSQNMCLTFAFNKIIDHELLDVPLAEYFIEHLIDAKNISNIRKKYILKNIYDYFVYRNIGFYTFRNNPQVFMRKKFLPIVNTFSNEIGGKLMQEKIYESINRESDLSIESDTSPKIAVCISGMFRNNTIALDSIYKNLVAPLNADVFLHTWDKTQIFGGGEYIGGNYLTRKFPKTQLRQPAHLELSPYKMRENFPHILSVVQTEITEKLYLDESKFIFTDKCVENEEEVINKYNLDERYMAVKRNSLNQIKMLYGIYKSFWLLKNYELKNNIKYDYVFRLRIDSYIDKAFNIQDLDCSDDLSVFCLPFIGFGLLRDDAFYCKRDIYEHISDMFWDSLRSQSLSPFVNYPELDSHNLLVAHLLKRRINMRRGRLEAHIDHMSFNGKLPNLREALALDLTVEKKKQFPEECEFLEKFLLPYCE